MLYFIYSAVCIQRTKKINLCHHVYFTQVMDFIYTLAKENIQEPIGCWHSDSVTSLDRGNYSAGMNHRQSNTGTND